jgi:hypothetical protein
MTPDDASGGHGQRDADALLVVALAFGKTHQQAAEAAGVSKATVTRRMRNPRFRERVDEQRTAIVEQASARLGSLLDGAAVTLGLMLDRKNDTPVRLRAAALILTHGLRFHESTVAQRQVKELRERLDAFKPRSRTARAAG